MRRWRQAAVARKKKKDTDPSISSKLTEDMPLPTEAVELDEIEEMPLPPAPKQLKHFEIISQIGKGGMGTVYLARDASLDREVALKVLSPLLTRDETMVERFLREARAQAHINHLNITQIYFIGEEQDCHFFAMELLEGKTLAEVLEEKGALPWEEALSYLQQAATGLAAAYERGVVHHDVKPSNLILTKDGTIKIADFGLAKRIERDSRITGTGIITGTPAYMSPEQGRGGHTDHRSDIYSLGASLFHLIAGRPPLEGDSPVGTIVQQITTVPPKLSEVEPSTPRRVSEFVARCLEKDPQKRYQSYDKLLRAIEECMPRKITPAGSYARFSAILFDMIVLVVLGSVLRLIAGQEYWLTLVVAYTAYFVLLESLFGWTPGKKVLKLAIRKSDGRRALPARIGLRFIFAHWFLFAAVGILLLFFEQKPAQWSAFMQEQQPVGMLIGVLFLLYLLGLASTAVTRRKRALHDILTGTIVMYEFH
jgi:uncharacterized RDD family membrane protein YckC/predicted Ser/Thr protein kinase